MPWTTILRGRSLTFTKMRGICHPRGCAAFEAERAASAAPTCPAAFADQACSTGPPTPDSPLRRRPALLRRPAPAASHPQTRPAAPHPRPPRSQPRPRPVRPQPPAAAESGPPAETGQPRPSALSSMTFASTSLLRGCANLKGDRTGIEIASRASREVRHERVYPVHDNRNRSKRRVGPLRTRPALTAQRRDQRRLKADRCAIRRPCNRGRLRESVCPSNKPPVRHDRRTPTTRERSAPAKHARDSRVSGH